MGFSLSENLPVGADAYIGPLQMFRIRRKFEKNTVLFCRGDEGIAPYDGVIPNFFDMLKDHAGLAWSLQLKWIMKACASPVGPRNYQLSPSAP